MSATFVSARNIAMKDIGPASKRALDGASAKVPKGTIIVSADNHWALAEDPWTGKVPEHLKDRMPRVWWDERNEVYNMSIGENVVFDDNIARRLKSIEDRPGVNSIPERMADMDAEGIAMEIVFPQTLLAFFQLPDFEAREWIFRLYNEYLAEVGARAPGRFFGVGLPNFWDPDKMVESVRHIKELGLKTLILPMNPGKNIHGDQIVWSNPDMDPLWSVIEDVGLPVYFHIGETLKTEGVNGGPVMLLTIMTPFRKNFGELVFGGVFDRHPKLRVIFAEAGLAWVPPMLQDAEMIIDSMGDSMEPKPRLRPEEYWRKHCYATFMTDRVGLTMLDHIGTDRIMWAPDYPHNEGTLGYSASVIEEIVAAVSPAEAKQILGGTAIELFDLV